MLTQEIVRELLDYEPETGKLIWKKRNRKWFKSDGDFKSWNSKHFGKEAFKQNDGMNYFSGKILDKSYRAHQIIWLWVYGKWPEQIDHINHDRKDNRWFNLREVSQEENMKNQSKRKDNISGQTGLYWCNFYKKWNARIKVSGKRIHLDILIHLKRQ